MERIWERAREVGRLVAQSPEYGAFTRANGRLTEDGEAVSRLKRLQELEEQFTRGMQQGQAPSEAEQDEYERIASEIQVNPSYQAFEVARTNFDRLMMRINEEIARGVEEGEKSRIILPG
jgi:cell fate (sporulation/competence/biofilm development) regulator YlbF (YheA/YmcA/DUF963 family)